MTVTEPPWNDVWLAAYINSASMSPFNLLPPPNAYFQREVQVKEPPNVFWSTGKLHLRENRRNQTARSKHCPDQRRQNSLVARLRPARCRKRFGCYATHPLLGRLRD